MLSVRIPDHNHGPTRESSHPALRKLAPEVQKTVAEQSAAGISPGQIVTALRNTDPTSTVLIRDIYNAWATIKREALGPLTPIQALMLRLDDNYTSAHTKDAGNRIQHLFFSHKQSQELLRVNNDVLIMDCTYRTNRFKLPLLDIIGCTALNTTFYVGFCFMSQEKEEDYIWVLQNLRNLYIGLGIEPPKVILTDCEKALMNAITNVWPNTQGLLCLWHVNKGIFAHCRTGFNDKEWVGFLAAWNAVTKASTLQAYRTAWTALNDTYALPERQEYWEAVQYLEDTWIRLYDRRIVAHYTNRWTHYGNTVTSRAEGAHAALKHALQVSTGDLKTVVDRISHVLTNQHIEYLAAVDTAKMRVPLALRIALLRDLVGRISPHALRKVFEQYERLTVTATVLPACTNVFTTTMGLPCSHRIQERLASNGVLALDDIHCHWHLERPIVPVPIDPRLLVVDPMVIRPRGRAPGSRGRNRAEQSTQRDYSAFELVEDGGRGRRRRRGQAVERGRQRGGQQHGGRVPDSVPGAHYSVFSIN